MLLSQFRPYVLNPNYWNSLLTSSIASLPFTVSLFLSQKKVLVIILSLMPHVFSHFNNLYWSLIILKVQEQERPSFSRLSLEKAFLEKISWFLPLFYHCTLYCKNGLWTLVFTLHSSSELFSPVRKRLHPIQLHSFSITGIVIITIAGIQYLLV